MNKTTSSKAVTTVALFATLFVTGACSGQKGVDPAKDVTKMTAITEEKEVTAEDLQALAVAEAAPAIAPTMISKPDVQKHVPSTIAGLDEVISLGKYLGPQGAIAAKVGNALWKLIEKNQAVVNLSTQNISLLPDTAAARNQVAGFRKARPRKFSATLKNLAGFEVVRYDYMISFYYGGNINGRGRFIENLKVVHRHVKVWPGFRLDAQFVTGNVVNSGTKENPVVVMPGEVRWSVKNVLTNVQKTNAFDVYGTGQIDVVSTDQEVKTLY